MDIFSHGLYGGVAFGRRSRRDYIIAFLFGIGPDLLAFGPYILGMVLGLFSFPMGRFEPPNFPAIPEFVHSSYDVTHSFIVYALFFALLWFLGKKNFAKLTLGWPLHILVDIPTHSGQFFPTPFLWPLSHFHVNGTPWGEPFIFIPNVILVITLYTIWYLKDRKRLFRKENN